MNTQQRSMVDVADSLREAGVPMARDRIVSTLAEGVTFVGDVGFPVVVKGDVPGITHKSDLGLVHTDVGDTEALGQAYEQLVARLDELGGGQVVIQEQAGSGAEFLLSARRVPRVGVLLTVGIGGSLVEIVSRIAVRLCPVDTADILDMFDELEMGHHLENWRGVGNLDIVSFVEAAVSLSSWMTDEKNQMWSEIEINPVIVHAADAGCTAVDLVAQP